MYMQCAYMPTAWVLIEFECWWLKLHLKINNVNNLRDYSSSSDLFSQFAAIVPIHKILANKMEALELHIFF